MDNEYILFFNKENINAKLSYGKMYKIHDSDKKTIVIIDDDKDIIEIDISCVDDIVLCRDELDAIHKLSNIILDKFYD